MTFDELRRIKAPDNERIKPLSKIAKRNCLHLTPRGGNQNWQRFKKPLEFITGIPELLKLYDILGKLDGTLGLKPRRRTVPGSVPHLVTESRTNEHADMFIHRPNSMRALPYRGKVVMTELPVSFATKLLAMCPPVVVEGIASSLDRVAGGIAPNPEHLWVHMRGSHRPMGTAADTTMYISCQSSWSQRKNGLASVMPGPGWLQGSNGIVLAEQEPASTTDWIQIVKDTNIYRNNLRCIIPALIEHDDGTYFLTLYTYGADNGFSLATAMTVLSPGFFSSSNTRDLERVYNELALRGLSHYGMPGSRTINCLRYLRDLFTLQPKSGVSAYIKKMVETQPAQVLEIEKQPMNDLAFRLPQALGRTVTRAYVAQTKLSTAHQERDNATAESRNHSLAFENITAELAAKQRELEQTRKRIEHWRDLSAQLEKRVDTLRGSREAIIKRFAEATPATLEEPIEMPALTDQAYVAARKYELMDINEYLRTYVNISASAKETIRDLAAAGGGILRNPECPNQVQLLSFLRIVTPKPLVIKDCVGRGPDIQGGPYEVTLAFSQNGKFMANLRTIKSEDMVVAAEIQGTYPRNLVLKKHPHAYEHMIPLVALGISADCNTAIDLEPYSSKIAKWVAKVLDQTDTICLGTAEAPILTAWIGNQEDEILLNVLRWLTSYNPLDTAGASFKMFPTIGRKKPMSIHH